jgi:hypothetical protein
MIRQRSRTARDGSSHPGLTGNLLMMEFEKADIGRFMQQQTRQVRQRQQQDDRRHQAWLNRFDARMARIAPEETRKAA